MRTESPAPPWWVDLVHPAPLGAAAVLFLNDHALKGAGILPGWLTGKLSDVAGLFVFPIFAVACLRWAAAAAGRAVPRGRALPWVVAGLAGALFTAVKLSPAANRWVSSVLGANSMDPSDLLALAALVPSALWMSRPAVLRAPLGSPAMRTAAAAFAGLACVATSKVAEPPQPRPGPARLAEKNLPCAHITPVTCRYDATRFVVRLSARRQDSRSCRVNVVSVYTNGSQGDAGGLLADAPVFELDAKDAALIGAWGRLGRAGQAWEKAKVRVWQDGQVEEGPTRYHSEVEVSCRPGFGDDTQPPAEVAR